MHQSSIESGDMRTGAERTLDLLEAQVGRSLGEVETPVAVVDLDRLEANLQRLQSYADAHGIALWPHTKTHKSPEIGLRQLAVGAGGLTVAKTGEAQVFQRRALRGSWSTTRRSAPTSGTGSRDSRPRGWS